MDIPKEKIQELKKQVIDQINSTFSEEKKQPAIQQVNSMGDSDFIEFLKQNNLINDSSENTETSQESPFRQIVSGNLPSSKVGENEKAIAVLEINPVSPGHTIIIPKNPISEPQYQDEDLNSKRNSAKLEELEEIQNKIISVKENSNKKQDVPDSEKPPEQEKIIIPKRIP
jgi:hypothetical protein